MKPVDGSISSPNLRGGTRWRCWRGDKCDVSAGMHAGSQQGSQMVATNKYPSGTQSRGQRLR